MVRGREVWLLVNRLNSNFNMHFTFSGSGHRSGVVIGSDRSTAYATDVPQGRRVPAPSPQLATCVLRTAAPATALARGPAWQVASAVHSDAGGLTGAYRDTTHHT